MQFYIVSITLTTLLTCLLCVKASSATSTVATTRYEAEAYLPMLEISKIGVSDYCRSELFFELSRKLTELHFHEFGAHLIDLASELHPPHEYQRALIAEHSKDMKLHQSLIELALQISDNEQRYKTLSEAGFRAARNGLVELSRQCLDSIGESRHKAAIWMGLSMNFASNQRADSSLFYAQLALDSSDVTISGRVPWRRLLELLNILATNDDSLTIQGLIQIADASLRDNAYVNYDGGLIAKIADYGMDFGAIIEVSEFGRNLKCACSQCCGIAHYEIVHRLIKSQQITTAYEYVNSLESCETKACLALELASTMIEADASRESVNGLLDVARTFALSDSLRANGVEILLNIADIQAMLDRTEFINAILQEAMTAATKIPFREDENDEYQTALQYIAVSYLKHGYEADAAPIIARIADSYSRESVFQSAAYASALMRKSESVYRFANVTIDTVTHIQTLLKIAKLGTIPSAIDSATERISELSSTQERILLSLEAVTILDSLNRREDALKLLQLTSRLVETLAVSESRISFLGDISRRLRLMGQLEDAKIIQNTYIAEANSLSSGVQNVTLPELLINDLRDSGRKSDALMFTQHLFSHYPCSAQPLVRIIAEFVREGEWEVCLSAIQAMEIQTNRNRALAILAGFYAAYHPSLTEPDKGFLSRIVQNAIR